MPAKPSLQRLKANVNAQESRLKEGIRILNAAKRKERSKGASYQQSGRTSEWDPLERVIGQMDELLISYKKYSSELERKVKQVDRKIRPRKKGKP